MPLTSFSVDGIHVETFAARVPVRSDRPPLLLVHGGYLGAWCWENWLAVLASNGWSAYALSVRNHAGSRSVDAETYRLRTRFADYVDDMAVVAEELWRRTGKRCLPIGHSMGGLITQVHAARERAAGRPVPALVLLASASPAGMPPLRTKPVPTDPAGLAPGTARLRGRDATTDLMIQQMVPESPAVMNEYSLAPGIAVDRSEFDFPLLAVSAGRDTTVVPKDRSLADFFGADYWLASDSGHSLMWEPGWLPVLRRVMAWLEGRV